jgi:uncharacterized protein involved in response to NO
MALAHDIAEPGSRRSSLSLFEYGYRPFFLAAGLQAASSIPLWVLRWFGLIDLGTRWDPVLWHAHEMLFGFAAAALAGFLLTAVPNWTGAPPVKGRPLALLAGLWLGARALAFAGGDPGAWLFAAVDLAFLPALALLVAPAILRSNAKRNGLFIVLLSLLFLGNLAMHGQALGFVPAWGLVGFRMTLAVFLLLITLVGGRILPAFTASGLKMAGQKVEIEPSRALDVAAIGATAAFGLVFTALGAGALVGLLAGIAALAHLARLRRWQGWRTLGVPLLWVLHLAYAWLPLGLALMAAAQFTDRVLPSAAVHALTAGCIGMMILAVMSRAALGHSGRPLVASPVTVASYILVAVGAATRVIAGFLDGETGLQAIAIGGAAWALGFVLFLVVYAPILLRPRIDGKPG